MIDIATINFDKLNGVVPAIIQDAETQEVLMLGFMNRQALEATLKRKKAVFWSRSKNRLWEKGETSGNSLNIIEVKTDCDSDSLLIRVEPAGPVCHTGARSCFAAGNQG